MENNSPPNSHYDGRDAILITPLVGIIFWKFLQWQYMPHFSLICSVIYTSASIEARSKLKNAIFNPIDDILSLVWRKSSKASVYQVNLDELEDCKVIGIKEAANTLEDCLVRPKSHPELFNTPISKPPKGILLYGLSGTGKTLVVSKYAKESGHKLLSLRASNLLDKFVGNTEKHIAEIFDYAQCNRPCIIFIDEIDCLVQKRNSEGHERAGSAGITSELLCRMDGLLKLGDGVTVIAATNFPWLLEEGFAPFSILIVL
jgi:ATP-dependent 26S proteasome regulatory subunit